MDRYITPAIYRSTKFFEQCKTKKSKSTTTKGFEEIKPNLKTGNHAIVGLNLNTLPGNLVKLLEKGRSPIPCNTGEIIKQWN